MNFHAFLSLFATEHAAHLDDVHSLDHDLLDSNHFSFLEEEGSSGAIPWKEPKIGIWRTFDVPNLLKQTLPLFPATGKEESALCHLRIRSVNSAGSPSQDYVPAVSKLHSLCGAREPWESNIEQMLQYLDLICTQAQLEGKLIGFFPSGQTETDGPIAAIFNTQLSTQIGEQLWAVLVQHPQTQFTKPFAFFRFADVLSVDELSSQSTMSSHFLLPPCITPPSIVTISSLATDFVLDRVRCFHPLNFPR